MALKRQADVDETPDDPVMEALLQGAAGRVIAPDIGPEGLGGNWEQMGFPTFRVGPVARKSFLDWRATEPGIDRRYLEVKVAADEAQRVIAADIAAQVRSGPLSCSIEQLCGLLRARVVGN